MRQREGFLRPEQRRQAWKQRTQLGIPSEGCPCDLIDLVSVKNLANGKGQTVKIIVEQFTMGTCFLNVVSNSLKCSNMKF